MVLEREGIRMNKCPRCKNENFNKDPKYCPMCGASLKVDLKVPIQERLESINNIVNEIVSILSWRCADNYKSALGYDKETETILIDEERLIKVIQLITPIQKKRNIKVVKGLMHRKGGM